MENNEGNTITIFNHTIQEDPLNQIIQTDNDTVYITPRFNTFGLTELKVGVLLPFSQTSDKLTESIVWGGASAIRLAINEINAAQLVPGAYVTLIEKDSFPESSVDQGAITNAVYALVTLLQQGVIGVIGDVTSSWTALSALMTSALDLPQCSFAASAISFSDKAQFKYFFRTIPTDVVMIDAMLHFVIKEGWTKIGVIYTDDPLGQQLYQRAIQQTEALDIQLINYQSFPSTETATSTYIKDSLDTLLLSGARIILVAAQGQAQSSLMVQAAASGYLSPDYVWLLVGDDMTTDLEEAINNYNKNLNVNNGTLSTPGAVPRPLSMQTDFNGLIYFVNWLTLDGYPPYDTFTAKWSQLDNNVYPFSGTNDTRTNEGLAYSCMMMMADGFQSTLKHTTTNHTNGLLQLASGNLGSYMTPQAFNSGYVGPEGPMLLDSNGDVMSGNYRIMNFQHGVSVPIGQSLVGDLVVTSPAMFFDGTNKVPSDSPPSIALNPDITSAISYVIMIVAAIGSLFALAVLLLVIIYRKNEIFKAAR
ncbi:periplasmic binding protein-like I [Absidia repens]|uniref:Periplasmic binding protein-like I n=1 Tax=Absidia repens TaxID=90262 RepID=A0A1X2IKZ5_9FUNG|nr:periplasmic binding protein-like I [Absidia repens]